jgi:hypothetical protein
MTATDTRREKAEALVEAGSDDWSYWSSSVQAGSSAPARTSPIAKANGRSRVSTSWLPEWMPAWTRSLERRRRRSGGSARDRRALLNDDDDAYDALSKELATRGVG